MKKGIIAMYIFFMIGILFSKTLFTIPWGSGRGEIKYYNSKIEGYDEIYPLGPQSIKFIENKAN